MGCGRYNKTTRHAPHSLYLLLLAQYSVVKVSSAAWPRSPPAPERRAGRATVRGMLEWVARLARDSGRRWLRSAGHIGRAALPERTVHGLCLVEPGGLEPPTSALQRRRSPS